MPGNIHQAHQRATIAKLVLDVLRAYGAAYLGTERYGTRADDLVLIAALLVGGAEGKPMGASKLASYAGWSRPSVVRRLNERLRAGLVRRHGAGCVLTVHTVNSAAAVRAARSARRRVLAAAKALNQPM
jgi:hypothetical protein